jgi:hypothetical protein
MTLVSLTFQGMNLPKFYIDLLKKLRTARRY